MSADWPLVTLKGAGINLIDCDHKTPKAQEKGLPYIGIPQLKNGRILLDGARLISEKDFHHWRRKANPTPDDVILSRRCNPGEVAYVPENLDIALGQNLVLLRSDGEKIFPPFLRWVAQGSNWWNQVNKYINVGAIFDSLKCADIPKFEFRLPPMEDQKSIAKILGDLDRKIELNRQTNQTLENIAQAIFKSWFVDFEPTRAKIAAKQEWAKRSLTAKEGGNDENAGAIFVERAAMAAISGKTISDLKNLPPEQQQSLKSTAALFPDTLTDSELGQIPVGWDEATLGNHFDVVMGQSPKGDTYNEDGNGMLFFQGRRDFGFRYPTPRVYTTAPKRLAQNGDTLISVRAPVGDRNMANQECCLGRGVAGIRHKSGARSFTYAFIGHIEKNLSDSGSDGTVFSSINKNELSAVGFVAPTEDIVILYEEKISSLDQQIEVNSKEIEILDSLRDILLPKLLSGDLPNAII